MPDQIRIIVHRFHSFAELVNRIKEPFLEIIMRVWCPNSLTCAIVKAVAFGKTFIQKQEVIATSEITVRLFAHHGMNDNAY